MEHVQERVICSYSGNGIKETKNSLANNGRQLGSYAAKHRDYTH
jgi:hypothetical protein